MKENRLALEKSPYLLQHKTNPVDWYPWGVEAFEKAQREDKPIFLSIGYSTCYWCHVMEKDSFEDDDVAVILNEGFVPIKVDREERPDIDTLYMEAITALTGHGGWPMSVFLTPEKRPFWGGTFFYKDQFKQILRKLSELWRIDRASLSKSSDELFHYLKSRELEPDAFVPNTEPLLKAIRDFDSQFDETYGGFGQAPKFPPSQQVNFLLRMSRRHASPHTAIMAKRTLDRMASGGIFDHIGGGFHRYSVDEKWLVPHFEKMLYDNALLACTYLDAYRLFQDESYRDVAEATLSFVLREMQSPQGGFYSALDAGPVGKEGEYYVWTYAELEKVLSSDELSAFSDVFQIAVKGNFEHGTIVLALRKGIEWSRRKDSLVSSALAKLQTARVDHSYPHLDDKILTGWNGLMILAMAKAFQVLRSAEYRSAAVRAAEFVRSELYQEKFLWRRYRAGDARFAACADDFAFLIAGSITLYEATFDEQWFVFAKDLQKLFDDTLWDEELGGYRYTTAEDVIVQKRELFDGATPSSNSVALGNLIRLEALTGDKEFFRKEKRLWDAFAFGFKNHPSGFPSALQSLDARTDELVECGAVSSPNEQETEKFLSTLQRGYFPNCVIARGVEGQPSAIPLLRERTAQAPKFFICVDHVCRVPVTTAKEALLQLPEPKGLS